MAAGFLHLPLPSFPLALGLPMTGGLGVLVEARRHATQQTPGGFSHFDPPGGPLMANNGKAKLSDLTPDDRNANRGTQRGTGVVETSLRKYGAGRSILVDRAGRVIAGNKTAEAAAAAGIENIRVVETDGRELVVVKRTDLDLDSKEARELAIADNRAGELNLNWDIDALTELESEGIDLDAFFCEDELQALTSATETAEAHRLAEAIATEAEYKHSQDIAADLTERVTAAINDLAENAPARLSRAHGVVMPKTATAPMLILDESLADLVVELQRYADAGEPSPLAALLAAKYPLCSEPSES